MSPNTNNKSILVQQWELKSTRKKYLNKNVLLLANVYDILYVLYTNLFEAYIISLETYC